MHGHRNMAGFSCYFYCIVRWWYSWVGSRWIGNKVLSCREGKIDGKVATVYYFLSSVGLPLHLNHGAQVSPYKAPNLGHMLPHLPPELSIRPACHHGSANALSRIIISGPGTRCRGGWVCWLMKGGAVIILPQWRGSGTDMRQTNGDPCSHRGSSSPDLQPAAQWFGVARNAAELWEIKSRGN